MNYKELSNAYKKINKWYDKKTKVLNIRTRPFNTFEIFSNVVSKLIGNSKILYVFCSDESKYIEKKKNELYESVEGVIGSTNLEDTLKCISIHDINDAVEYYDLVIFDDISLFSKVTDEDIRDAVEIIYWRSSKIIIYATEFIFPIGEKFDFMYVSVAGPMAEPRLMNTRMRLEDNIPMALFEYFKWFKKNKKRVAIIVPTEEKLNKVYNHYYEILRAIDIRVVRFNKNQNVSFINEITEGYSDALFIITNSCGQYVNDIQNLNIVLLFADDLYYSYKKIVYLCGAVNNCEDAQTEVIMVSKELTEDMDRARIITRGFNRFLWEKQYLKL